MAQNSPCDRERLKQLLSDTLPASVERDVSEHVGGCPDCLQELESLAAHGRWWNEASQRLSRSAEVPAEHGAEAGSSFCDEVSQFANDFAVDFLDPTDDPEMLGRLGEYEIVEVIGRGGMGIVLKGFQKELHRHVAVKVLSPHLATSGAARRRFAREAQATAAVVHPHVMAIHSVQANARLPYLVMPFVACESLQERLDKRGPIDVKDVLRIGMQAALGLAAAHAQGLVHRDVKPANILLETNVDRVLLTDFGLARAVDDATLTRTGIIAGTPQYMSPEQANGDGVDHRSDIFSLGGVLYAMCTGRPPFRAETTFGVLRRIRETSPRSIREINADIPEWLEAIVLKLLEKEAGNRPATAQDVAGLLEQCLAHVQNPTMVSLPQQASVWCSRPTSKALKKKQQPSGFPSVILWGIGAILAMAIAVRAFGLAMPSGLWKSRPGSDAQSREPGDASELTPGDRSSSLRWDAAENELDSAEILIEQFENELNSIHPGHEPPIDNRSKESK